MSGLWPGFESCTLAVTVHFHDRGIGHGVLHIRLAADGIKAFLPDTGLDPAAKALEDGVAFAESFGPIAPEAACAHDPQRGLYKQTLVRVSWPCIARFAQAVRGHQRPLPVAQYSFFHGGIAAQEEDSQQALASGHGLSMQ